METAVSPLVLTIVYWLHMLATVVWVGGLAAVSIFVLPAARRTLDAAAYSALITQLGSRLQQVGWFSLVVLVGTGMFQMSANPSYKGFLAISNNWAVAIFAKHVVIGLMVLVSAYVTWGLMPRLQRTALLRVAGRTVDAGQASQLENQETWLIRLNLILSVVVLLLTAWARSSQ
jgi:uncharacterized membrane protein